jgi:hypothetical protein
MGTQSGNCRGAAKLAAADGQVKERGSGQIVERDLQDIRHLAHGRDVPSAGATSV